MSARRPWALPLVPLYAAGLAAKDALRNAGLSATHKLQWPVVSVGSLSAGGAGKTPVSIALAELLRGRGWHVDILSRGYGRTGRGVERVDIAASAAAHRFGDEPVMMAQRLGVPVWVGANRFATGMAAEGAAAKGREADSYASLRNDNQGEPRNEEYAAPQSEEQGALRGYEQSELRNDNRGYLRSENPAFVHLLDDGFQHRHLARRVDVALVTVEDMDDALLPAGNRREPLTALCRADAVVLREEERASVEPRVRPLLRSGATIWTVRRELRLPFEPGLGTKPLAFCAIARPNDFQTMLAEAGWTLANAASFADHHIYTDGDVERLAKAACECGATGFLTTEKDAVKLSDTMLERLRRAGPVGVVSLDAKFVDEAEVTRAVEALIS